MASKRMTKQIKLLYEKHLVGFLLTFNIKNIFADRKTTYFFFLVTGSDSKISTLASVLAEEGKGKMTLQTYLDIFSIAWSFHNFFFLQKSRRLLNCLCLQITPI